MRYENQKGADSFETAPFFVTQLYDTFTQIARTTAAFPW
jgi:hypothetical protein